MGKISLHGFGGWQGLLDLSPFVCKLHAYFRLAKVEYETLPGNIRKAPRGKLPYITHNGQIVGDSALIVDYLRNQGGVDLDAALDDAQRAERCALSSMFEQELYFIILTCRWRDPAGWASYAAPIGQSLNYLGIPKPLSSLFVPVVRRGNVKKTIEQGAGRRPVEENLARAHALFDAFEQFVGRHDGPWWFGNNASSVDAIAWAFVGGTITKAIDTPNHNLLDRRPNLRTWFEHAEAQIVGAV